MSALELWAVLCRVQLPHVMGSVHLQRLAGYVLVRYQSAFTLAWDGASAVYIKMSPEFLGWTHGLCGNNNADPQDDLVTSYGEVQGGGLQWVWVEGWVWEGWEGLWEEPWVMLLKISGRPLPTTCVTSVLNHSTSASSSVKQL